MDQEMKRMLDEEIKAQIKDLSNLQTGSKEKSEAVNDLETLYRLRIDETKNEIERDDECKKRQLSEQVKDRYIKYGLEAAGMVLPLIFYGIWMRKGFKFEETGTFTSTTFRGLFNRFRPTQK